LDGAGFGSSGGKISKVGIAFDIFLVAVCGRVIEMGVELQAGDVLEALRTQESHVLPYRCG
tara:strand:+ start:418 stop:600 length:183 start_codon:yes stop_codon:yes gene_type:complete